MFFVSVCFYGAAGRRRVRRFTVNQPGGEVVVIEMDGEELE